MFINTFTDSFPKGFRGAGAHIGIKKQKKDLALIISDRPAVASGMYTKNIVKAAPVVWDQKITDKGTARGIIINSGNANACTGEKGDTDCFLMATLTAGQIGETPPDSVLVCSTGVIGVFMPMEKFYTGVPQVYGMIDRNGFHNAAEAITTTDTFVKVASVEFTAGGNLVKLCGMAKGSGMIHPNMATMLAFITTDADISKEMLDTALRSAVEKTFNMISVDGDTSTNDTILALANGAAENARIDAYGDDYEIFAEGLFEVCKKLAIDVAKDGEGATKLIEVRVKNALDDANAVLIAKSVVSSSLFKAMLFGADANFGRVLCAMGYSGGEFDPAKVNIYFESEKGRLQLMSGGAPVDFDEVIAKEILSENEIVVDIGLSEGSGTATAWGCDLTYDYVKINGDYRS